MIFDCAQLITVNDYYSIRTKFIFYFLKFKKLPRSILIRILIVICIHKLKALQLKRCFSVRSTVRRTCARIQQQSAAKGSYCVPLPLVRTSAKTCHFNHASITCQQYKFIVAKFDRI